MVAMVMAVVVMAMAIIVVVIIAIIVVIIITTVAVGARNLLQILLIEFDCGGLLVAGGLCSKCAENIFHDVSSFFLSFFAFRRFIFSFCLFACMREECFVLSVSSMLFSLDGHSIAGIGAS